MRNVCPAENFNNLFFTQYMLMNSDNAWKDFSAVGTFVPLNRGASMFLFHMGPQIGWLCESD